MKVSDFILNDHEHLVNFAQQFEQPIDDSQSILDLFRQQVEHLPNAIAGLSHKKKLSYAELDARSNQVAHYLIQQNLQLEQAVGICINRSPDFLIAVLGVLKAGGCFVPLEPQNPQEYLENVVNDAKLSFIITAPELLERFQLTCAILVTLNDPKIRLQRTDVLVPSISSKQLAFILYTSGPTGIPKGVLIPHRQLLNWLHALWQRAPFNEDEIIAQKTSMSFAVATKEIFAGLLKGVSQVFIDDKTVKDVSALVRELEYWKVTRLYTFPSELNLILDEVKKQSKSLIHLQYFFISLEACPTELLQRLYKTFSGAQAWYNYGCTEINDICYCEREDQMHDSGFVPVGKPIHNTKVFILDDNFQVSPTGIMGQVYVESVGLARGYWRQPGLTAERFIANPFGKQGSRLYCTGDLGRYLENGVIELLGRADYEVKVRGYRVDIRQVEKNINTHSAIVESAVIGWPLSSKTPQLAAYVVLQSANLISIEELRDYLTEKLPTYMVPTLYQVLPALPRLSNNKIDRLKLPDLIVEDKTNEIVLPRTSTEQIVYEIWQQLLQQHNEVLPSMSVTSNFFILGGHSLLATQLFSRIRQAFGIELPVSYIFEYPVLEILCENIDRALAENNAKLIANCIDRINHSQAIPLSYMQERLWIIHEHIPEQRTSFNLVFGFQLDDKPLSITIVHAAIHKLIARHDALRTTIHVLPENNLPIQVIAEKLTIDIPAITINEQDIQAHVNRESSYEFDLSNDALIRVKVLRVETHSRDLILFNLHHIIADGWSQGILYKELKLLYQAELAGTPAELPPLPVQYPDFAVWQRQQALSAELDYWKRALKGYDNNLELFYDYPPSAKLAWRASMVQCRYPQELVDKLIAYCQQEQSTFFIVLYASLAVTISQYTNRLDLCIGTTVAGRNQAELENLIGFFINILPLRITLSNDQSAADILRCVKAMVLNSFEHQNLPFEHLLNALKIQRDTNQTTLVPIIIRHQNFPMTDDVRKWYTEPQIEKTAIATTKTTPNELDWQFYGDGNYLELMLEYASNLFSEETIKQLITHHQMILKTLLTQPKARLRDIVKLTPHERDILAKLNMTERSLLARVNLGELFDQQVLKHAKELACVSVRGGVQGSADLEQKSLTYEELQQRVNLLTRRLKAKQIGAESIVGVWCDRSESLLISLLSILKLGACYVPLDKSYPLAYLSDILCDVKANVVLGQGSMPASFEVAMSESCWIDVTTSELSQAAEKFDLIDSYSVKPSQLACIAYTSGSTGKPKGVMVSYGQLQNCLSGIWDYFETEAKPVVLQKTALNFVVSLKEILSSVLSGWLQVMVEDKLVRDNEMLQRIIEEWQVSRVYLLPSHLQSLLSESNATKRLQSLRHIVTAGEALPRELCLQLKQSIGKAALWNNYGCTELNDVTYYAALEFSSNEKVLFAPIGRPIQNTRVYILDEDLRQVPLGVEGELYVESVGLSRGYWRRPGLTAERFIADPYSVEAGGRFYRTGDRVRCLANGELEFIGRQDFEVKIRGYRVDVRQVESVLNAEAMIEQAVVSGVSQTHLVAYLVVDKERFDLSALRARVSACLPTYMQPTLYSVLENLPRLPNGKLDRLSLPEPDISVNQTEYEAPRGDVERVITGMFSDLLSVATVGRHDNFFNLGGHSLNAAKLISKINTTFSSNISLIDFFAKPTAMKLSQHIIDSPNIVLSNDVSIIIPIENRYHADHIFCVHPIGGQIFHYLELANTLSEIANIYGIIPPSQYHLPWSELVNIYCDEIQAYQTRGSYRFVGWSSGGLLAMAIASELEKRHCTIDYIGLIDSKFISVQAKQDNRLTFITILNIIASLRKQEFSNAEINDLIDLLNSKNWTEAVFDSDQKQQATKVILSYLKINANYTVVNDLLSGLDVTKYYLSLLSGYEPVVIGENTFLYLAKDNLLPFESNQLIQCVNAKNIRKLEGNHYSVLLQKEKAKKLGHVMKEDIQQIL